jgi:eukaryotic-like serine/threonine-protein kinase
MSEHDPGSEETIFSGALQCAPAERGPYLDQACAGRPALRQRVEELLRAQPELGEFMEMPAHIGTPGAPEIMGLTIPPEERPGTRIGRYKLLQKIGEGGCGVVYMAEQEEPVRRRVALKVIKLGMDTKSVIARFEAERQALAMMDHPNIAKVLDGGATETGRPYFVMELVRGTRITEFCDLNRLPTRERLNLFIQVCQAVQHAHQKGIIHRDLKPSNVLVTVHDPGAPGVPMIIDFGIAKATQGRLTDRTLYTAFEQFLGTPAYMSPEQAMMTALDVDTRSDIYSLGVLLYELLTGHTPFDAKELLAAGFEKMRRTIREKEPPRPSTRLSTLLAAEQTTAASCRQTELPKLVHLVRGDLDWIVMKCLEKDRARRYETANGLAMDLQRHLKHEPVVARPPSRFYLFQKTVRRHKVSYAAAALVMVALSLGLAGSLWQASRARRAEREQRYRAYVADMNLAQQAVTEGDLGRARSLLRTYVPKSGESDLRNWEWRYLANECRGDELYSLVGHEGLVSNVRFLDNNTLVTTGLEDLRTILWDLSKRRAAKVITNVNWGGGVSLMAFAPKHRTVYYRPGWNASTRVQSLELETGLDVQVCETLSPVTALDLSPDEGMLAIASGKQAELRDVTTKNRRFAPVVTSGEVKAVAFSPDARWLAVVDARGALILRDLTKPEDSPLANIGDTSDVTAATTLIASDWWCRFSPDGRSVLFASSNQISVCHLEGRALLKAFEDSASSKSGAFSPDGKWLATVGEDTSVRLWDTRTGKMKFKLAGHTDPLVCVDFAPDGRQLATASRNGEVRVWSVEEQARRSESADLAGSQVVGVVRDGSAFWRVTHSEPIVRDGQNALRITGAEMWSASPMKRLGSIEMQDLPMDGDSSSDFSSGGRTFVVGSADNTIHLRGMGDREDLARTPASLKNLNWVQMSLDGSTLVGLCYYDDWPIRVWRLPQMELIAERKDIPDVHLVCLSEDGKSLAVLTGTGRIGVLSIPSLKGPPPWKAVPSVTSWTTCAFSPDGRRLATAVGTGNTFIWDLATRNRISLPRSLSTHDSISFSPDGTRLVASDAHSTSIFDTATGQRVVALNLGGSQVAFTRDGKSLLAVRRDRAFMLHAPRLEQLHFDWFAESLDSRSWLQDKP